MAHLLPEHVCPGDILFQRGSSLLSWAIRTATKSQFAHVAIVVDRETIIEARPGGIRKIKNPYPEGEYEIRTCDALVDEQREDLVTYAKHFIGKGYDYLRILSIFLDLVFHVRNRFYQRGRVICSVYIALVYRKFGVRLRPDKIIRYLTPEDLYESKVLRPYSA